MTKKEKSKILLAPTQLQLLTQAINSDDKTARFLVNQALQAVRSDNPYITDNDLDTVISLIREVQPENTKQALLAVQAVVCHVRALHAMTQNYVNSNGHSMSWMRLSHMCLDMLNKEKRQQNIVNSASDSFIEQ